MKKGTTHAKKTIQKMKKHHWTKTNKIKHPMLGKYHTIQTRQKMRNKAKTDKRINISIKNLPKNVSGSLNGNWKNGISTLNNLIRTSKKYEIWRNKVFENDNWTCQKCNQRGGDLEVHHKVSFIKLLKINKISDKNQALECNMLWDITLGKTLCKKCHSKIDKYRRI